jgi:hypothetical protein
MFCLNITAVLMNSIIVVYIKIYLISIILKMVEKKDILTCEIGFLIVDSIPRWNRISKITTDL